MITKEYPTSTIMIVNLNLLCNKNKWSSEPTIINEAELKSHKSKKTYIYNYEKNIFKKSSTIINCNYDN